MTRELCARVITWFSVVIAASCGGVSATSPEPTAAPASTTSVVTGDVLARPIVIGISRRVAMLDVILAPGETFEAPPSTCQDTMLLVREGVVYVAPEGDQEAILRVHGGIRFGAIRPSTARARREDAAARALVVVTRPADAPFDEARGIEGIFDPPARCGHGTSERFALASPEASGPFEHEGGRLRVSIFLDGRDAGGALSSLSLLEGTADVAVPRHAHEISDEVLFIASGDGTMTRGTERVPVHGPAFVWVPAGVPHAFERSGDAPLVAYQVYSPAGPEQRFRRPSP